MSCYRSNPLTGVALSSILFLCGLVLFVPHQSQGQTADNDAGSPAETPTPKPTADPVTDAEREEQAEKLRRRPGEKTEDGVDGRTLIMGMKVRESDNRHIKVTEVAPSTPAFEAGIREGDELVSFDGFKADSYREWIDGIRKITTDAKDGDKLPMEVMRAGKKMDLRIRIPESRANELRPKIRQPGQTEYAQEGADPGQAPTNVQINLPNERGYVGGGGLFFDDTSVFDDGNSGQANDATGRAVAHLMRVGEGTQPEPSPVTAPSGARNAAVAPGIGGGNIPNNQQPGTTPPNQNRGNNVISPKIPPTSGNGAQGVRGAGNAGQGSKNLQQPLKQQLSPELLAQVDGQRNAGNAGAQQPQLAPGQVTQPTAAPTRQANPKAATSPTGNASSRTNTSNDNVNSPTGDAEAGGRVGIAGFQNTEQGMVVTVEVGGLPPGNYRVGIGDPSAIQAAAGANDFEQPGLNDPNQANNPNRGQGGRFTPDPVQGNQNPEQRPPFSGNDNQQPENQLPAAQQPGSQRPGAAPNNPNGGTGGGGTRGAGSGQGAKNLQQPLKQQLSPQLLAQVAGQPRGGNAGAQPSAPPTGQVNQQSAPPATGNVNSPTATPTGQSQVNEQARNQSPNANDSQSGTDSQPGTDGGTNGGGQIGTLRVDQSGIGRMRQTVDGVRVNDVVGQALVIFGMGQATPSVSADQQRVAGGRQEDANRRQQGRNRGNAPMPVAAGVINFISDQPNGTNNGATNTDPIPPSDASPNQQNQKIQNLRDGSRTNNQPTGATLPPPTPRR